MKFDAETVLCNPGDTVIIPQMRGVLLRVKKGKILTIFKNKRFNAYLEKPSKLSEHDFENLELMKKISAAFDSYEG